MDTHLLSVYDGEACLDVGEVVAMDTYLLLVYEGEACLDVGEWLLWIRTCCRSMTARHVLM